MVAADLSRMALELPPEERLELARRLVESVAAPAPLNEAVAEGIRRIEDMAAGWVEGLTQEQYRAALGRGCCFILRLLRKYDYGRPSSHLARALV